MAGGLLSSCSGPFRRSFQVNVIDTSGEKVPAIVLLDGEPYLENSQEPVVTPTAVELEFSPSTSALSGFAMRKLGVRAVFVDEEGQAMSEVEGVSPYKDRERVIFFNDASTVLFIVEQNPEFQ